MLTTYLHIHDIEDHLANEARQMSGTPPARICRTTTRNCSVGPSLQRLLPLPECPCNVVWEPSLVSTACCLFTAEPNETLWSLSEMPIQQMCVLSMSVSNLLYVVYIHDSM